jgi:hypothetical protein
VYKLATAATELLAATVCKPLLRKHFVFEAYVVILNDSEGS